MSPIAEAIELTIPSFAGQLLRPDDFAYEERRRVHNGLIDKHPAVIASCHGIADIVDAVQLAHTLGLEVSVRGGGHNVAGRAAIEAEERRSRALGVTGVPFFVFNQRLAVSGAQPPEVLLEAIEQSAMVAEESGSA